MKCRNRKHDQGHRFKDIKKFFGKDLIVVEQWGFSKEQLRENKWLQRKKSISLVEENVTTTRFANYLLLASDCSTFTY